MRTESSRDIEMVLFSPLPKSERTITSNFPDDPIFSTKEIITSDHDSVLLPFTDTILSKGLKPESSALEPGTTSPTIGSE